MVKQQGNVLYNLIQRTFQRNLTVNTQLDRVDSGICCYILASLLFLKHFNDTGEKLLELTPTEQLQK